MLPNQVIHELKKIIGPENVITNQVDLVTYSFDATADMPSQVPDVVVTPENTGQVQAIVMMAAQHKVPLYPRGSGTNLSGGTVPLQKGIVLSTVKMNRIIEVDAETLLLRYSRGLLSMN